MAAIPTDKDNISASEGSSLALILFMLAAKVLVLPITQASDLQRIKVPGSTSERHILSASVDGSTVFINDAKLI